MSDSKTQSKSLKALEISRKAIGNVLIGPGGPRELHPRDILETGRQIRDKQLHQFPILPGAVNVFQQIASSRGWYMSGRPRSVSRAVQWVNNAETFDIYTGQTYYGYQQYLQRRALDYLTIGRTTFAVRNRDGSPLEYIDPGHLRFQRQVSRKRRQDAVKPSERVWRYKNNENFRSDEIYVDHAIPIGSSLFISPIAYLLPSAHLAWLLREHHATQLDGRKIRDIIMVGGAGMADAIEHAIIQQAALYSGADPSTVGIPVVEVINNSGSPLTNFFATLGISNISEQFNEDQFLISYTNQIAAGIGLALRQFWNDESTTNRALEDIQEQRQQQKGPSFFIRTEQRMMNNSGVLERFGRGVNKVRFGFVEETDLSTKLSNAEVLRQTAEALKSVGEVFGSTITPQSYLAWMQNLGVLPYEVELVEGETEVAIVSGENDPMNSEDETTQSGDESPTAFDAKSLNYDEVIMDQDGNILEKRLKVFSVLKLIADEMYAERLKAEQPQSDEEAFELALTVASEENCKIFRKAYADNPEIIDMFIKSSVLVNSADAEVAVHKCENFEDLNPGEQEIIDILVTTLELEKVGI